jgi:hypothetical protein
LVLWRGGETEPALEKHFSSIDIRLGPLAVDKVLNVIQYSVKLPSPKDFMHTPNNPNPRAHGKQNQVVQCACS